MLVKLLSYIKITSIIIPYLHKKVNIYKLIVNKDIISAIKNSMTLFCHTKIYF